ncbi:DnaJ family domain-containing protein [Verrucomicrobium spinosum]|uniref:DnaJ family domain-containing protein n=1 Tax=Verrucomicrobium spinosum TaxID=2736 RepID=UPI0002D32C51|nr:DnaJ family domain-containing protein [Verrucomicrobium spinosum]
MSSPFAQLAEARIKEAIDAGEFDNLSGKGQPLDMDGYFSAPSSLRSGFGLLKSASVVPPEVTAMLEVAGLRHHLESATGERAELLRKQLQMKEVELTMALERVKRALKADVIA